MDHIILILAGAALLLVLAMAGDEGARLHRERDPYGRTQQ